MGACVGSRNDHDSGDGQKRVSMSISFQSLPHQWRKPAVSLYGGNRLNLPPVEPLGPQQPGILQGPSQAGVQTNPFVPQTCQLNSGTVRIKNPANDCACSRISCVGKVSFSFKLWVNLKLGPYLIILALGISLFAQGLSSPSILSNYVTWLHFLESTADGLQRNK